MNLKAQEVEPDEPQTFFNVSPVNQSAVSYPVSAHAICGQFVSLLSVLCGMMVHADRSMVSAAISTAAQNAMGSIDASIAPFVLHSPISRDHGHSLHHGVSGSGSGSDELVAESSMTTPIWRNL